MKTGQRVRLRAASPIAKRDEMAPDAVGTVICCYTTRARVGCAERVDVKFSGNTVMWGVAAHEFEAIEDNPQVV